MSLDIGTSDVADSLNIPFLVRPHRDNHLTVEDCELSYFRRPRDTRPAVGTYLLQGAMHSWSCT